MENMKTEEMEKLFQKYVENAFDYEKTLERQNLKHEYVVALRQKAKNYPAIPKLIFNKQLVLFANLCGDGDIDKGFEFLKRYYEIKQSSPEFFSNRNPESEPLQKSFQVQQMAALPITPDNFHVFIHRVSNHDPKEYDFDSVFKMFIMMAETSIFKNGPRDGAIFISDWTGIKFGHLLRPSISSIRKSLDFIQHACPIQMKAVHVFNASHLVQIVFSMVRPFLRAELYNIIHLHSSDTDYNEFFEKYIPRTHMPSDYGGELASVKDLHEKNVEMLLSMKEYFLYEEMHMNHGFDEYQNEACNN